MATEWGIPRRTVVHFLAESDSLGAAARSVGRRAKETACPATKLAIETIATNPSACGFKAILRLQATKEGGVPLCKGVGMRTTID